MKVFNNDRTDNNNELIVRKGSSVPEGAVSLGWYKSPNLNPKNNLVTVDTSRFEGPSGTSTSLAYGNALGVLEDLYGNQTWPEEFPIVGDRFLIPEDVQSAVEFLPYVHISRYLHLDSNGLAPNGSLSSMVPSPDLKILDEKGKDYVDENGNRKYDVFAVNVPLDQAQGSRTGAYRIWVFLNTDPVNETLYLTYHKFFMVIIIFRYF